MPRIDNVFDIVVVGGGPAGLSSAIFSSRLGKKVALIEKGDGFAPEPRGETLHDSPILSELLGEGFMDSISLSKTEIREFYSPDTTDMIELHRKTPSIVFKWEEWIDGFKPLLDDPNIEVMLNTEVKELIVEDNLAKGILVEEKSGKQRKIYGKAIFACDGYRSVIGRGLNIDYKRMNFPMVKCLMRNGNYESKGFKYFFVPAGSLEYAPDFPPFIIFLFPREEKNFEMGILIQADNASQLGLPMPTAKQIMGVWVKLKDSYPVFSTMIKGSSIAYEKLTALPMTGTVKEFVPVPGVVLLGDAAGFIETSGGSGLVSSIKMAKIWSQLVSEAMDKVDMNDGSGKGGKGIWTDENIDYFIKVFDKSDISRHVRKVAKLYNYFRKVLFVKMGTKEKIMKNWGKIRFLMKQF